MLKTLKECRKSNYTKEPKYKRVLVSREYNECEIPFYNLQVISKCVNDGLTMYRNTKEVLMSRK